MKKIVIILSILVVVIVIIKVSTKSSTVPIPTQNQDDALLEEIVDNSKLEVFQLKEKEYDFGTIKQSGGIAEHNFSFTYNGAETIKVIDVPTSCQCTSAKIDKKELKTGDTATITVFFDPNLHEEPKGKFFKTITLLTEPNLENLPEIKIWAEIDLDLGADAYKLKIHND